MHKEFALSSLSLHFPLLHLSPLQTTKATTQIFHRKFFRQLRSNSNFRFCSFIETHHRLDQDFRQTFLSHCPFHHSSWCPVKCLFPNQQNTCTLYILLSFARCSSCNLRTKNKVSVVPFQGMKPNCVSSK